MNQEGEEVETKSETQVEIQERGEVYFFYRPKVEKEEAHSVDEVQRLYIVLRPQSLSSSASGGDSKLKAVPVPVPIEEKQDPHSGKDSDKGQTHQEVNIEKQSLFRFIVMGRKSLPDPSKRGRPYWGFVDLVTTNIDHIKSALKEEEYVTATRGHRHTAAARAVGEGIYRIVKHNMSSGNKKKKPHTHFIYQLEFPTPTEEEEGNEPQESLNIKREGSFIIQIKNPEGSSTSSSSGGFRGLQSKRKAAYPAHLQGQFGGRYCAADPPDFLNYQGCEFLLISASDDIEEELGLELKLETETSCSDLVDTFGEATPTTPLLKGTWV